MFVGNHMYIILYYSCIAVEVYVSTKWIVVVVLHKWWCAMEDVAQFYIINRYCSWSKSFGELKLHSCRCTRPGRWNVSSAITARTECTHRDNYGIAKFIIAYPVFVHLNKIHGLYFYYDFS